MRRLNLQFIIYTLSLIICAASALPLTALADPHEPSSPYAIALAHESQLARGAGSMLPAGMPAVVMDRGTLTFPADNEPSGFPDEFLSGLVGTDDGGITVFPFSVAVNDGTGATEFMNSEGEIFWTVLPTPAYSADWVYALKGADAVFGGAAQRSQMAELTRPGRVVSRYAFAGPGDLSAYAAAKNAGQAQKASAKTETPGPKRGGGETFLGVPALPVAGFEAEDGNSRLIFSRDDATNSAHSVFAILYSTDLRSNLWFPADYADIAPSGTPLVTNDVPRYAVFGDWVPPPDGHLPSCEYIETEVLSPLDPLSPPYTNIIYTCGCVFPIVKEAAFFRAVSNADTANCGVPDWWRGLWGVDAADVNLNVPGEDYTYHDAFQAGVPLYAAGVPWGGNGGIGGNDGGNGNGLAGSLRYVLKVNVSLSDVNLDDDMWDLLYTGKFVRDGAAKGYDSAEPVLRNEDVTAVARKTMYITLGRTARFTLRRVPAHQNGGTDEYRVSFDAAGAVAALPRGIGWIWRAHDDNSPLEDALPYGPGNTPPDPSRLKWEYDAGVAEFITPRGDPLARKEMNDGTLSSYGQNQYTYSSASPGTLTVNLAVKVTPASLAAKIAGRCYFAVPAIAGSTYQWDAGNPGGRAAATSDGFLTATVTYEGLPSANDSFGVKTARLRHLVDVPSWTWRDVAETDFAVYFPRDAENNPTGSTFDVERNWFYYWKEGDVCGIPPYCSYNILPSFIGNTTGSSIEIGQGTLADGQFKTFWSWDSATYTNLVGGWIGEEGIKSVAECVYHEQLHVGTNQQFGEPAENDRDEDGIPDVAEADYLGIKTNPDDKHTYPMSQYPANSDTEIRPWVHMRSFPFQIYPKKDWANPGCQHKNYSGPPRP